MFVIRWREMLTTLDRIITKSTLIEKVLTIQRDIENELSQRNLFHAIEFRLPDGCCKLHPCLRHFIVSELGQRFEKWYIKFIIVVVRCYALRCLINFIRIRSMVGTDGEGGKGEFLIMEIRVES